MNITQEKFKSSLINIARSLNMRGYDAMSKGAALPELTKILIVELFTQNNCIAKDDIQLLREYRIELQSKGFVEFK
jgi:hypothetical protein